jgi:predicted hotdog family 3-hydroxylacyl-ACP dehydratase
VSAGVPLPVSVAGDGLLAVLPHRPPILLLESAPWVEPDRAIALTRPLGLERTGVPRSADGTVPELLMVEAVAQLVAVAVIVSARQEEPGKHSEPQPGVLAGIPEFRFHGSAPAGARLAIVVDFERRLGRIVSARGEVFAGARLVAEGRVTLGIGPV